MCSTETPVTPLCARSVAAARSRLVPAASVTIVCEMPLVAVKSTLLIAPTERTRLCAVEPPRYETYKRFGTTCELAWRARRWPLLARRYPAPQSSLTGEFGGSTLTSVDEPYTTKTPGWPGVTE
jgi:hypothetical protein